MLGSDVVALFPSMKEINTGKGVSNQVRKSPLKVRVVDYMEVARYCAGNRK